MKNIIKALTVAVKYASYITIFIEVVNFTIEKLETVNKDIKQVK